jgi:hypothetical protein
MKKINATAAVLFAAVLALAGPASLDHESRRHALLDRYARSSHKLDSLERDTLARGSEQAVYSRLLREAHTRRDHTQSAIDLLGYADTTDPTAWEVAHAHAVDSLDSLERFLRIAERDTLKPAAPRPPSSLSRP